MKIKTFLFCIVNLLLSSSLVAADWFAYATDISNFQVIPFDVITETAGNPIPAERNVSLAISPDASTLYAINQNITNSVSVIDLNSQTLVNTINLNAGGVDQTPYAIAITPDGTTAYISAMDSSNVPNLLKLDLASGTYIAIPVPNNEQSNSVAITPDGSMVYLTRTSSIIGMSTSNNIFELPINVTGRSTRIAISPDGQIAYVTDMINSWLYAIDLATQTVQTIPLTAGLQPTNLAISANNEWIYIANENSNSATAIDILNNYAVNDILLSASNNYAQQGVAISPDSQKAVFSNTYVNQITTVQVGTTNVTNSPVSGNPNFIAITPDQAPVASFTSTIAPPSLPSTFTSTSTTLVGTITNYVWDFGDGTVLSTTVNPVQHTYTSGGSYLVTLQVTNSAGTSTTQTFTGQTVSNNGGPSAITTNLINVPFLAPIVTTISPSNGGAGDIISITGSNLIGTTQVLFGNLAANFVVQSDNLIIATVPNGNTGTVAVTVTTPGGTSIVSTASQFTYQNLVPVVTAINPSSGLVGNIVSISGSNLIGTTQVLFGNLAANFVVQSDNLITAIVPNGNTGTIFVTVITPVGTSSMTAVSQFTYQNDLLILPPNHLVGKSLANQFVSQTDYIHRLNWQAPITGIVPVAYYIYDDENLTRLVATVSANERLNYAFHHRRKNKPYDYYVVSVGPNGEISPPLEVTVISH